MGKYTAPRKVSKKTKPLISEEALYVFIYMISFNPYNAPGEVGFIIRLI